MYERSVEEARQSLLEISLSASVSPPECDSVEDRTISGPNGGVPVRLYFPPRKQGKLLPILLYFHGGGFALGNIETHDGLCRYLAVNAGVIVVSVDYRLTPEHPFPAGLNDCYAVLERVASDLDGLGADSAKIYVCGDSAGGNLAAAVSIKARDEEGPEIALQILLYPVVDMDPKTDFPSREAFGGGDYFLSKGDMVWLSGMYVDDVAKFLDPLVSPLHAKSHADLPQALIVTAGFDPLVDDGRAYADKLLEAGVTTTYKCFETTIHGFLSFAGVLPVGQAGLDYVSEFIRDS